MGNAGDQYESWGLHTYGGCPVSYQDHFTPKGWTTTGRYTTCVSCLACSELDTILDLVRKNAPKLERIVAHIEADIDAKLLRAFNMLDRNSDGNIDSAEFKLSLNIINSMWGAWVDRLVMS